MQMHIKESVGYRVRLMRISGKHWFAGCRKGPTHSPVIAARQCGHSRTRRGICINLRIAKLHGAHIKFSQIGLELFHKLCIGFREVQHMITEVVDAVRCHQTAKQHFLCEGLVLKPRRESISSRHVCAGEESWFGLGMDKLSRHFRKPLHPAV